MNPKFATANLAQFTSLRKCANQCNGVAQGVCRLCHDAPTYGSHSCEDTYYCSETCSTAHWSQHQELCKFLQSRVLVAMAAKVVERTWRACMVRSLNRSVVAYINDPTDRTLTFHMDHNYSQFAAIASGTFGFISPLGTTKQEHFDAMLTWETCSFACATLHTLVATLLDGILEKLEIVVVHPKNQRLMIQSYWAGGIAIPNSTCHDVFKLTMKNGDTWILDPTATQYGFSQPLLSLGQFLNERVANLVRVQSLADHYRIWDREIIRYDGLDYRFQNIQIHEISHFLRNIFTKPNSVSGRTGPIGKRFGFIGTLRADHAIDFDLRLEEHLDWINVKLEDYIKVEMLTEAKQLERIKMLRDSFLRADLGVRPISDDQFWTCVTSTYEQVHPHSDTKYICKYLLDLRNSENNAMKVAELESEPIRANDLTAHPFAFGFDAGLCMRGETGQAANFTVDEPLVRGVPRAMPMSETGMAAWVDVGSNDCFSPS